MDAAFHTWVPVRRGQVHRTHGELIGVRAERDHAALHPLPAHPYRVSEAHLRRVGRDSLISFAGSSYSVPARAGDGRVTRAGQRVEVRVSADGLTIHRLAADGPDGAPLLLAEHQRAAQRGAMVVDPAHWAELPDGHTRATILDRPAEQHDEPVAPRPPDPLPALLTARPHADIHVAHRPLADYDALTGTAAGGQRPTAAEPAAPQPPAALVGAA